MKIFKKLTSAVSAFFIAGSVIALTGNTLKCHARKNYNVRQCLPKQKRTHYDDYQRKIPDGFISILGGIGINEGSWSQILPIVFIEKVFWGNNMEDKPYPIFSNVNCEGSHYNDIMEIILQKENSNEFSFYPKTLKDDIITRYCNITGRQPNDFIAYPANHGEDARFINIFREVWGNSYRCDPYFRFQIDNVWKKQVFDFLGDKERCDYDDVQKIQLCMCLHDILADLKGEEQGLLASLRAIKPDFDLGDVAPPEGFPDLLLVNATEGKKLQFTFRIKKADGQLTNNITLGF